MKTYNNSVVLRNDGTDPSTSNADLNAGVGINITVRVASTPVAGLGALASIFDIADVAIANPMQTDDKGNYQFKTTDGLYDIVIAEGTSDEQILSSVEIVELITLDFINNLSLPYVFDTVAAMVASTIVFPVGKVISTGIGKWSVTSIVTNTQLADGKYVKLQQRVGAVDLGMDNTGVVDVSIAIANANIKGYPVTFNKGTYLVSSLIPMVSNLDLWANNDAEIVSTISTVASSYMQIFKADAAVSNIKVEGLKFSTTNYAFSAFGFYGQVTNLSLINNECEGCALTTTFAGAVNANVSDNYIHNPASEGIGSDYERAIQLSCNYNTTESRDLIVTNNTILGSWTHGIEITGNSVFDQEDPLQPKNVNGVVVSGNIVRALSPTHSAGAIWFAQVADVTVTNNVCELYGDVGIDFEACRNAVAIGNTLTNNNKNLAMYGNSNGVLFEGNVCYNTTNPTPAKPMSMFYAKPVDLSVGYVVDERNTNISLKNNTFHYSGVQTGLERLEMGSGGEVEVIGNTLVNVGIIASQLSLTSIQIKNNKIKMNQGPVGQSPIQVAQAYANGDTNTNAFKAAIKYNEIEITNPSSTSFGILYQDGDTTGANVDIVKHLDIVGNSISTSTDKFGIYVQQSSTVTPSNALNCTVIGNETWGSITFNESGNRLFNKNVSGNTKLEGFPYSTSHSPSGGGSTVVPHEMTFLSTVGASATLFITLVDGEYTGQIKHVVMSVFSTWNCVVVITNHRLGVNQQATFSGVGQYMRLEWNIDRWDTLSATAAGI